MAFFTSETFAALAAEPAQHLSYGYCQKHTGLHLLTSSCIHFATYSQARAYAGEPDPED